MLLTLFHVTVHQITCYFNIVCMHPFVCVRTWTHTRVCVHKSRPYWYTTSQNKITFINKKINFRLLVTVLIEVWLQLWIFNLEITTFILRRLFASSSYLFNTTCFGLTGHHQVYKIVDENCCSAVAATHRTKERNQHTKNIYQAHDMCA
jgi:hypothetical protein